MTITLKIQIRGIKKPPVWRRLEIPAEFTFHNLHRAIQESFGWWDCHLYRFEKSPYDLGWTVGDPQPCDDEYNEDITDSLVTNVYDFLTKNHLKKFVYVYDFGDSWVHDITVEGTNPTHELSCAFCLAGKGACPPEDCGGIWGYDQIKRLFAEEPDSEDAKTYLEWLGLESVDEFDTTEFDIDQANIRLMTADDDEDDEKYEYDEDDEEDDEEDDLADSKPLLTHETSKPEAPKRLSLLETVKKMRKDEVIELAGDLGLEIDTTLKTQPLREAYAKAVLNNPRQVLSRLPMQDLMIIQSLKEGLDGPNMVDVYDDFFDPMLLVYRLAQEWEEGINHYLIFSDDFRDAVTPIIDEVMDDMEVHHRITVESYVEGLANLYGQVPHTVVKETLVRLNQVPSLEVADLVLKQTWQQSLLMKWIETGLNELEDGPDDDSFYCSRYGWEDPEELNEAIMSQGADEHDYRQFDEMEIIMASRNPMPLIPNPAQQDFEALLTDKLHMNEWDVLAACHDLWYFAMHNGEEGFELKDPDRYFRECVLEPLQVDDDLYAEALEALDDYLDHMPHWQLKGHTPALPENAGLPVPSARRSRRTLGYDTDPWLTAMPFIAPHKVGRNDPCPCGSGKKYKNCCGRGN